MSKPNREEIVGYGLTYGQVSVIKMQRYRFNARYRDLAKHYRVTVDAIRQVVEGKQFDDIVPLGGYV